MKNKYTQQKPYIAEQNFQGRSETIAFTASSWMQTQLSIFATALFSWKKEANRTNEPFQQQWFRNKFLSPNILGACALL